jgi:hypothetical protein
MELRTYKAELRKAFSAGNNDLIESLVCMSQIDHEIDETACEEISDYCVAQAYRMVQMKKAARKTAVTE